jgi:hypothetical protein
MHWSGANANARNNDVRKEGRKERLTDGREEGRD